MFVLIKDGYAGIPESGLRGRAPLMRSRCAKLRGYQDMPETPCGVGLRGFESHSPHQTSSPNPAGSSRIETVGSRVHELIFRHHASHQLKFELGLTLEIIRASPRYVYIR